MEGNDEQLAAGIYKYWHELDFDSQRLNLDRHALKVKQAKEESLQNRKMLAEKTKAFRTLATEEKLRGIGPLLRMYQEEIDRLTKRAKDSEGVYVDLYKSLATAPDPTPVLQRHLESVDTLKKVKDENQRLVKEISEYEEEFSSLKNQDITIRNLQQQIENFEAELESRIEERTEERSRDLTARVTQLAEEKKEADRDHARELEDYRNKLLEAQSALDNLQSQLLEQQQEKEEERTARMREVEYLRKDAALTRHLQEENESLRSEITKLLAENEKIKSKAEEPSAQESLRAEKERLEEELKEKESELHATKEELYKNLKQREEETTKSLRMVHGLEETIQKLQRELAARPSRESYAEIQRQLAMLQQFEFDLKDEGEQEQTQENQTNSHAEDSAEGQAETSASLYTSTAADAQASGTTDQLVVRQYRKLQTKFQFAQREKERVEEHSQELAKQLDFYKEKCGDQSKLIEKLENDLLASESRNNINDARSSSGPPTYDSEADTNSLNNEPSFSHTQNNSLSSDSRASDRNTDRSSDGDSHINENRNNGTSNDSDTDSGYRSNRATDRGDDSSNATINSNIGGAASAMSTDFPVSGGSERNLVEILRGQRDRFKQRMEKMEQDVDVERRRNKELLAKIERLNKDNVALYEKIKYLQSYRGKNKLSESHLEEGGTGIVEQRYEKQYTASLNPFQQFSSLERQKQYSSLSLPEKATLSSSRLLLSSKAARTFVFFYALALHALVFCTLYYMAYTHTVHL